jgi:hypothetical protein
MAKNWSDYFSQAFLASRKAGLDERKLEQEDRKLKLEEMKSKAMESIIANFVDDKTSPMQGGMGSVQEEAVLNATPFGVPASPEQQMRQFASSPFQQEVRPSIQGRPEPPQYDPATTMLKQFPTQDPRDLQMFDMAKDLYLHEEKGKMSSQLKAFDAKLDASMKHEGAFNQVRQAGELMATGVRDAMIQHQDKLAEFGIDLDPTRGISGLTFSKTMQLLNGLGYNDYMNAVGEGLSTEMAVEIAKMLGQGAGMRMGREIIRIFRKTLPQLGKGTLASNLNQLTYTLSNAYRKMATSATDANGQPLFKTEQERINAVKEYDALTRQYIFGMFERSGLYKTQQRKFEKEDGVIVEVPDYLEGYFTDKGYKKIRNK